MANAAHDGNNVPTLTAALNTDGATIVRIKADGTTHAINIVDAATGSDNGPTNALHDQNHVPTAVAFSSSDGITPVVLYADSSGNLLVNSS